jgi:hypothetical protein
MKLPLFQKVKNGVSTSILLLPKANGPSTLPLYPAFIISNSEILSNDGLVPNLWVLLPILNDFMNVLQLGIRCETKVQTGFTIIYNFITFEIIGVFIDAY